MKMNRSLQDINAKLHKAKEYNETGGLTSPRTKNPQMASTKYKLFTSKTPQTARLNHSHKNLPIHNQLTSQFSLHSPKYVQIGKGKFYDIPKSILTPNNKNNEQPRKPKILSKSRPTTFHEDFKVGKVLGKGRFGNVLLVKHLSTGGVFAAKQISLQKVSDKLIERLVYQIKIQSFLRHPNCLQLYKYYKEQKNIYLILQMGQCSLFDILRERRYFNQSETAYYIRQTIKALIYLHEYGIIHRDLKPQNIVLVNNIVKLADFGWSIYTGKGSKRKTFCGTLDYVCPQIILGSEYDEMVDVWSVGIMCYQLCTGHAPFESNTSRQQTYRKILNIDIKYPKHLSIEVRDFIAKILNKRPEKRMTLQEALSHPWMIQFQDK